MLNYAVMRELEEINIKYSRRAKCTFITAIYSTKLGPALGGCRMIDYTTFDDALMTVTDLAKTMAYKAVIAGLPFGGGKSVIISHDKRVDRKIIFEVFGELVNSLGGRYIAAVDSGTTTDDMRIVADKTPFVVGFTGQKAERIDPAFYTAIGVFSGIKKAANLILNKGSLVGLKIAIQGVGKVGFNLCRLLADAGAVLIIADIDKEATEKAKSNFSVEVVSPDDVLSVACDILSPCAYGYNITHKNLKQIKAKIICGCANHVLSQENVADDLMQAGIVYCPDYLVNCGGLMYVARLYKGDEVSNIKEKIANQIEQVLTDILVTSKDQKISPLHILNCMVEKKLGLSDLP